MYPAVRALHERVRPASAETLLLVTRVHRDGLTAAGYRGFEVMQDQLYADYKEIHYATGST